MREYLSRKVSHEFISRSRKKLDVQVSIAEKVCVYNMYVLYWNQEIKIKCVNYVGKHWLPYMYLIWPYNITYHSYSVTHLSRHVHIQMQCQCTYLGLYCIRSVISHHTRQPHWWWIIYHFIHVAVTYGMMYLNDIMS